MAGLGKFRKEIPEAMADESTATDATTKVSSTYYSREFASMPEEEETDDADDTEALLDDDSADAALRASEKQRIAAADALKSWIEIENPTNYKILERLEKDIRANRQLNEWGSFALDDLLRPPMTDHSQLPSVKWGNRITVFRNLLLFAPVLVTWYAIENAARAYKESKNAGLTFLNVWGEQTFSLAKVAMLDAAFIASLIVLTLASHLLEWRADAKAREIEDDADNRFRDVMVEVGLFLHGFRQITPSALKGGLADAVNQLKEATTAMNDTAISMSQVADRAVGTLEEFAALSAKEFAPAAERLATLATTLETTSGAHSEMSNLVVQMQKNLDTTVGSMAEKFSEMTDNVVTALEENAQSLSVALSGTVEKVERIGTSLEAAAVATNAAVESMALRSSALRDR